MKKKTGLLLIALVVALGGIFLPGCLKDKVVRTYTIYTPVFTRKDTVLAALNGDPGKTIAKTGQIYTKGSFIYLNDFNAGIHVIDNSNPSHPVQTAFLSIPGNQQIAMRGNILYADMYGDILGIDIADPKHARITDTLYNLIPYRNYAVYQYVLTGWTHRDTTMSESSAESMRLYSVPGTVYYTPASYSAAAASSLGQSSAGTAGSTASMTLIGDYLYVIPDNGSLGIINVSDPSNLTMLPSVTVGSNLETIFPMRNRLLIGSKVGVYIYSIDNPAKPASLGEFQHGRACDPVIADDNNAYVTLHTGTTCGGAANELDVLDAKDLSKVSLLKTYPMTYPLGLGKDGSLLFVCDSTVVKVFDASDPVNLKQLTTISVTGAFDVIASNHLLIVVSPGGLDQFDYSNPSHIVALSHLSVNQSQK